MTEEKLSTEDKPKLEFIPFHAINEFMRSDFRVSLLRGTLLALPNLSPKTQSALDKATKKYVKVPGFRNSAKAPASVKAVGMVKPFEKEPSLVAVVLSAWAEANAELRQRVFDILTGFEWKLLPIEANRTRLPGFLTQWPEEDDYERIYSTYTDDYPESEHSIDDVSLMAVWLAMRLPVNQVSKSELPELPIPDSPEEES
jgi:hypothetical protein